MTTNLQKLLNAPGFFWEWRDVYGTEPVRTRALMLLEGCPFERRKGRTNLGKQRLSQSLARLADNGKAIFMDGEAWCIERAGTAEPYPVLWILRQEATQ